MDLKIPCEAYAQMRSLGFRYKNVSQVMAKIPEELQEVKEAIAVGDREHLKEELGDLIQATLVLSDFLGIDGNEALSVAFTKLKTRFNKYIQVASEREINLHTAEFEEKIQLWKEIKNQK